MSHVNDSPSSSSTRFDVIVVGARAAGAATAMLLARAGLSTLLVDRSRFGADTLSTHALMRGGVLQLSRWGLLDAVVAAGTPPVTRTTFRYGGDEVVISIKSSHGVDALYAPRRTILDPLLVNSAIDAGADVRFGIIVDDVLTRGDRVTGISARSIDGRTFQFEARMVVGADGITSTIADRVAAPYTREGKNVSAATYGYWSDLPTTGYEWTFRPNAAMGVIPTNDGQACVFASALPDRIGRGGIDVIRDIVMESQPELGERLARAVPPLGTRTWRGRRGYMRQSFGPGWALAGDAGYFKDPLSAHGLTDALRDAELLSRAIVTALESDRTDDSALADYQATRDRLSIPLFDVVDRIAGHQWSDDEIGDLLLQLSSAMSSEVEALATLDAVQVS